MAKFYFRYGAVGSAKSLNMLAVAHNYRQQNKKVLVFKPALDTRFGALEVQSRAGLSCKADVLLYEDTAFKVAGQFIIPEKSLYSQNIYDLKIDENISCILVDESQFLSEFVIEQLFLIVVRYHVPIICYGLKTDFKGYLFSGSRRLLELVDSIEEVKTTCTYCNRKATFNLKFKNGKACIDGAQLELGAEETYKPACKICYVEMTHQ